MRRYLDDCLDADLLVTYLTNAGHDVVTPRSIVRAIGNLLASGVPIVNEIHVLNHWR